MKKSLLLILLAMFALQTPSVTVAMKRGAEDAPKEALPSDSKRQRRENSEAPAAEEVQTTAAAVAATEQLVDVEKRDDSFPELHNAAYNGNSELLEKLLITNCDANFRGKFGYTALHWAALKGHADCVAILLRHGVDVNAVDLWHRTALHLVLNGECFECIKILIRHYRQQKIDFPEDISKNFGLLRELVGLLSDDAAESPAPQAAVAQVTAAAAAMDFAKDDQCGICFGDFGSIREDGSVVERLSLICCEFPICRTCLVDSSKKTSACPGCRQEISDMDLIELATVVKSGKRSAAQKVSKRLESERKAQREVQTKLQDEKKTLEAQSRYIQVERDRARAEIGEESEAKRKLYWEKYDLEREQRSTREQLDAAIRERDRVTRERDRVSQERDEARRERDRLATVVEEYNARGLFSRVFNK